MKIGYFLYDEGYSGVIESQALDVVRFFNNETDCDSILIAALPFRSHRQVKRRFEESLGQGIITTIALPQKMQVALQWLEVFRLTRKLKKAKVDLLVCRNALACSLALRARKMLGKSIKLKVCYDGRGALKAEAQEYNVYPDFLKPLLFESERNPVLNSDMRIAVSEELIAWWKSEYGYDAENHIVIPTTISTLHQNFDPAPHREVWREKFGFKADDFVMAFAGGKADWQGMDFWLPHMHDWLRNMPDLKLLLLTPENTSIVEIHREFPNRVTHTFVAHNDVLKALSAADIGILWRNPNTTNFVASPTKLSEYLQAGLRIITNDDMAVSRVVRENNLGLNLTPEYKPTYLEILRDNFNLNCQANNYKKQDFYADLISHI
jgi:hypothetical protein